MLLGALVAPLSFPGLATNRADNRRMHAKLQNALRDIEPLIEERGWTRPEAGTIEAAERLLSLVGKTSRPPEVQANPDGTISFDWEAADHGWLTLTVDDQGQLTHSAVLGEDEFAQAETFGEELPGWAATLLQRLLAAGH